MNFTTNTMKPRIATKDIVAYIVIDGSYKSGRRILGDKKNFKFNKRIQKEGDVEMWHIYTHIYPKRKTEINGVPIKIEDINFKGYGIGDGVYHLYYQWNPYGSSWGNMHWGHAVSRDLINWEQHSMVMEPDEYGTVFSGSAYKDINNAAAFGRDALLYFYTAAGGTNKWSVDRGAGHTQRLAVSFDGGEHLEKKGLLIDHIKGGNRDPKVFYHDDYIGPRVRDYLQRGCGNVLIFSACQ